MKCKTCSGSGLITCKECYGEGMGLGHSKCPHCSGIGSIRCENCDGRGKISFFSRFRKKTT